MKKYLHKFSRNWNYFAFILAIILPYFIVIILSLFDLQLLIKYFPDDAFYYLKIASNIVQKSIISFDGVNKTTGFHPLQQIFTSFTFLVFGKYGQLYFLFALNAFVLIYSYLNIFNSLNINNKILPLVGIVTLPLFSFSLYTSSGMESTLLVLLIGLLYAEIVRYNFLSPINNIKFSCLISLIFLCRLDMVIPLTIIQIFYLYTLTINKMYKNIFYSLLIITLVASPYFLWIYDFQNSIFPISSIVKHSYGRPGIKTILYFFGGNSIVGSVIVTIPVLISLTTIYLSLKNKFNPWLSVISTSTIIYTIYIVFIAPQPFRWYLNYPIFSSSFLLIFLFSKYKNIFLKYQKNNILNLNFFTALNILFMITWLNLNTVSSGLYNITTILNSIIPANSNLATLDAGVVGYFSTSNVHNLDGLVNSRYNWINFLKDKDYIAYIKEYKISYILLPDYIYHLNAISHDFNSDSDYKFMPINEFNVPRFGTEILVKVIQK